MADRDMAMTAGRRTAGGQSTMAQHTSVPLSLPSLASHSMVPHPTSSRITRQWQMSRVALHSPPGLLSPFRQMLLTCQWPAWMRTCFGLQMSSQVQQMQHSALWTMSVARSQWALPSLIRSSTA